tara:strand:+ start:2053 stop:2763 length:711 start_codon:yes stop_codon:yes gene_type:complete
MQYDIIAFCSENYRGCYEFSINSWLDTKVRKIFIYTDGWEDVDQDDRVVFVNLTDNKESDWVKNVGHKITCINDYWDRVDSIDDFCFLDVDNYITRDITHIFEHNKTVGLTRIGMRGKTVSSGNVFLKKTPSTRKFIDDWLKLQEEHKVKGKWKNNQVAYDQSSIHNLTIEDISGPRQYSITSFSGDIYNSEDDHNPTWIEKIKHFKPYLLHFKANRWKDANLFKRIKLIVDDFTK